MCVTLISVCVCVCVVVCVSPSILRVSVCLVCVSVYVYEGLCVCVSECVRGRVESPRREDRCGYLPGTLVSSIQQSSVPSLDVKSCS